MTRLPSTALRAVLPVAFAFTVPPLMVTVDPLRDLPLEPLKITVPPDAAASMVTVWEVPIQYNWLVPFSFTFTLLPLPFIYVSLAPSGFTLSRVTS